MILSYCDLSITPAFQTVVADVTPELGDRANKEVFQDYMEQNGRLRTAEEILTKLSNEYFSTIPAKLAQAINNELILTQTEKFKDLGRGVPKKQLSNNEIFKLKQTISKANNDLVRREINRVYKLEDVQQVGQSDNYTWKLAAYLGNLDTQAKSERVRESILDSNFLPNPLQQAALDFVSYKNEPNQVDYKLKVIAALESDKVRQPSKNLQGFYNDLKRQGVSDQQIDLVKNIYQEGISKESLIASLLADVSNTVEINSPFNTDYYSKLTVPGGINYTESEIKTPDITPSIKGHAQFSTDRGIGWVRWDEQTGTDKIRRLLELQSDLFQKGRSDENLVFTNMNFSEEFLKTSLSEKELQEYTKSKNRSQNKNSFLQLLNKNNNWVNFFTRAVIQDSAKNNYQKVLFPTGKTVAKIEGFENVEDYIEQRTRLINQRKEYLNKVDQNTKGTYYSDPSSNIYLIGDSSVSKESFESSKKEAVERVNREIEQFQKEVDDARAGRSKTTQVSNFYQEVIYNVLKKQGYNPKLITDEHGNDWYEVEIKPEFNNQFVLYKNFNQETTVANYSQEIIRNVAEGLKLQVGVDFAFISPEEADEITKKSRNPWKGQNAFFYQNKAYFIAGRISPTDVLHEFVHPIIKTIADTNKPLFNNLYSKIQLSDEGKKIIETVSELYPNLDRNSDDFKEEVLVRGIEQMRDLNSKEVQPTSAFQKFINDLLYAIKQLLREVFGQKIRVQNLSPNTTLQELSDILEEGGKFELDPEIITDKDLVNYKNEYNKVMKGFVAERADKLEIEKLTNNYFETVKKFLVNLKKQENLGELANILENKYGTGELQKMQKNLKSYQTLILKDSKELEDEIELTQQRATAVINSLGNADNMISYINDGLKELVKDINNPENVRQILYYQKFVNYWGDFVANAVTTLEANGVREVPFINNVIGNVDRANRLVNDFYLKSSKEFLTDTLKGFMEEIDSKGKARIEELQRKNAPVEIIDKARRDYEAGKLTPKMIEDALKGNLKDMSWAGAYMEEFGASPDPVVGGLALFIQNRMTEMEVKAQQRFSDVATTLKPLLQANGYDQFNSKDLGEKLGQKELVGKVNSETGELEENEIWRFQNQFIGADIVRDRYLFKVKEAGLKYAETHTDEDKQKLADIQAEWADHKRKFWNDKYTEPFYQAYDILKKDEIGNEARMLADNLYDELNELSAELERASALDVLEISDAIESKRREIRQISSLYDLGGNLKTGRELEIAERLQEFNTAIKDIYESVEIPGAFQAAYQAYEEKLQQEGKNPAQTLDLLTQWKSKNVRAGIKEEFWTKMDAISKAIKDIMSKIPQQEELTKEIDDNYRIIKDLVKGNRDESGQPLGTELSPEKQEKVRLAQERIDAARTELDRMSGLSQSEQNQMNLLMAKVTEFGKFTDAEAFMYRQLTEKQGRLRLNKVQRAELRSLFNELDELRSKEPTDSYVDTVNDFLSTMNSEVVYDVLGYLAFDKNNIGRLSNMALTEKLFNLSDDFKEWFERNHLIKDSINYETNEDIERYERTYVWNVIKPRDEKYYDTTTIENLAGETIKIQGLASLKFYKRLVKDEYLTKKVVGETVDNRGYWLPKTVAQGAADDRYENKEYLRLKQADPNLYNLLEKMKEIHLQNQQGAEGRAKLWLDMPRFRKEIVERLQGDQPVQRIVSRIKDFWTKVKDGFESGFNYDAELNLVKLDLIDNENSGIPVSGLANLPLNEVSTDIIFTSMKYMLSVERNKALAETAPMARAIQKVVNDKKNIPSEERLSGNSIISFVGGKKSRYVRQKSINNYIEKTYEGVQNVGFGADSAIAQNFSNFLFKRASTTFLAFNIPSGIKNAVSMKFQSGVEAVAGKYLSPQSLIQAEKWATQTTMKYSTEIYKQGPKSLDIQLSELFDPERGKFQQSFGQSFTRTPGKDTIKIMDRMNDFRSWVQLQASLQTLGGMLIHEKIPTKTGNTINYMDAWELKNDKIQIKDTVDSSYGVSYDEEGNLVVGEKFKTLRNKYQRVLDNLNGTMGREQRPEADRYLLFRYVSFFRRFLTSMLTNRFGYSGSILSGTVKGRYDYRLGENKLGWYIEFGRLVANTFRTGFKNLPYMTSDEKAAFLRMTTEVGTVAIMQMLIVPLIFAFDDEDEDRYKKLKAKSGPLPLYGVVDDPAHPFDLGGWLSNHALLQFEQVSNENDQFIIWPGAGLNNFKEMLDIKSLVLGPTLKSYLDIINDAYLITTGNEKAYYQRDANAYKFAQQGELKVWNHIGKAIGFNASSIDPVTALKNFESMQNR